MASERRNKAHVHVSDNCQVSAVGEGCQVSHGILCIHFMRMNDILNIDLGHC